MVIPRQRAHSSCMSCHSSQATALFRVVDLYEAFVCTDSQVRTTLNPRHRGDEVIVGELA